MVLKVVFDIRLDSFGIGIDHLVGETKESGRAGAFHELDRSWLPDPDGHVSLVSVLPSMVWHGGEVDRARERSLLRIGPEISVALSPFAPRKDVLSRSERRHLLFSCPVAPPLLEEF